MSVQNTLPDIKQWTATIPGYKVREAVKSVSATDPGPLTSASIAEKGSSGRANKDQNLIRLSIGGLWIGVMWGGTEDRFLCLVS